MKHTSARIEQQQELAVNGIAADSGLTVPEPRRPAPAKPLVTDVPAQNVENPASWQSATIAMPHIGSRTATRTRRLRAWMLMMPMDFVAFITPLLWTTANWKGVISAAGTTVIIFAAGGLYRGRRHLSILDLLPGMLGRLLIASAVIAMIAAQRHDSVAVVGQFMRTLAISCGLVIAGRTITTLMVLMARKLRWVEHGAMIVGTGAMGVELARLIRRYPQYGLRFNGFVDQPGARHAPTPTPLIGYVQDLEQIVTSTDTDVVIIADSGAPEAEMADLIRQPVMMKLDVWVVPRLYDFHAQSGPADHIGAVPLARLHRASLTGAKWALKRTFDLIFAILALVIASPVMLLCALAVRIEGGPGILFRQQRIGRFGKPFDLLKFRSMRPSSDHESQTNWSVAQDPRVGPVGRLLRRTSLDELPQLWNIVRGDMTFVGPRPERPYFVDMFSAEYPTYMLRHRVPVGLTGLAQVSGLRGDTPISDRARFDNYYIDTWSPWLDIKVLLRTIAEVFRGGGR